MLPQIGLAARQIADEFDLDIRHLAAGVSGLTDGETTPAAVAALVRSAGAAHAVVAHDATTSYLGARGTAHGAVVAAGTGVVTLGVGPGGAARVDGWGYLMGDAGSGFWLGREALVAAMRDHDGRGTATALTDAVRGRWPDLEQAYIDLQADPARVSIVASFAAEVAQAGADGDAVALDILRRAGDLLAESALTALQKKAHYFLVNEGNRQVLNRDTINEFHAQLVDRVDASFLDLPERKILTLEYDPFVGKLEGMKIDPEVIARHNQILAEAQAEHARSTGTRDELAFGDSELGKAQRKCFTAVVRMGQFEFSSVLGMHGAKAFGKEQDPSGSLYEEAVSKPSQTMRLIARLIQSRQDACHVRVAVFCEKLTELEILKRFLEREGGFGELFVLEGSLSAKKRNEYVHRFLGCPKGIFLFSKAGSVGITLCPGCEVLLSVGSLPWNAATVDQAFGRVYRIGQTRPVEIVQFAARRSVTSAKLRLHEDKRERLAKAAADEDFSNFVDGDNTWRQTRRILSACVPLDSKGNYQVAPEQLAKLRAYRRLVETCDANGVAPPAPPPGLPQPPMRADQVALPPVAFPVPSGGVVDRDNLEAMN
nr:BadF/BadG/BcrA/BcrD ATPase family protein [uncultured Microbacterium sp.]